MDKATMLYMANKKSTMVGYVLWFFVGMFGAHRFYFKNTNSATVMLACTLFGIAFPPLLHITVIMLFVDIFLMPGMAKNYNNDLISRIKVK